ncbi:hypothetical protein ACFPH6_00540 [Streptomyces xiangluensis]|uniref:Uncharacterized protein n=1 Tax=Streptomyces xiangluensis TaxID=2665720 RepID=A0ABV8YH14_9ACTN
MEPTSSVPIRLGLFTLLASGVLTHAAPLTVTDRPFADTGIDFTSAPSAPSPVPAGDTLSTVSIS